VYDAGMTATGQPFFVSDLARSRHNLGYVLAESGKPTEAEAEYRKAMAVHQKLVDRDPAVIGFRAELANNLLDLGILLSETGRPAQSEAEYRRTIALYQKLIEDNPKVPDHRVGLAGALYQRLPPRIRAGAAPRPRRLPDLADGPHLPARAIRPGGMTGRWTGGGSRFRSR